MFRNFRTYMHNSTHQTSTTIQLPGFYIRVRNSLVPPCKSQETSRTSKQTFPCTIMHLIIKHHHIRTTADAYPTYIYYIIVVLVTTDHASSDCILSGKAPPFRCRICIYTTATATNNSTHQTASRFIAFVLRLCLDHLKNALCKKRFSVTSNLRYMYGVLNVDKIKN
jgi:hypothetical protein